MLVNLVTSVSLLPLLLEISTSKCCSSFWKYAAKVIFTFWCVAATKSFKQEFEIWQRILPIIWPKETWKRTSTWMKQSADSVRTRLGILRMIVLITVQSVITTRIYVLQKIIIPLIFISYTNSDLLIPAKKLQTPG